MYCLPQTNSELREQCFSVVAKVLLELKLERMSGAGVSGFPVPGGPWMIFSPPAPWYTVKASS